MTTAGKKTIGEQDFERLMVLARGFQSAKTFLVANQLDIFTLLADRGRGVRELARSLKVNERALRMLLDALVALELLQKQKDRYYNRPVAQAFLVKGKKSYRGVIFDHLHNTWEAWSRLGEAVKKGKPPRPREELSLRAEKKETRAFIYGMYDIARGTAPGVAELLDLSKVKRMLDLGGGPGTYPIIFARKNPRLQAVVFDLPLVIPITREIIRRHRLEKRIKTQVGDYHRDSFGKNYDLVLMSQILHSNSEAQCQKLIRKAYKALNPGGQIVIHEFAVDESRTRPPMAAIFALHMLVNTSHGTTYTPAEMSGWLRRAGCRRTETKTVGGRTTLVIGWK